jgi:3-oxoacyl-[acyl-carrier protein] reductase
VTKESSAEWFFAVVGLMFLLRWTLRSERSSAVPRFRPPTLVEPRCSSCSCVAPGRRHQQLSSAAAAAGDARAGGAARRGTARRRQVELAALEAQLGYRFRDRSLLDAALTHASLANERLQQHQPVLPPTVATREQLEVVGDAALDLVMTLGLLDASPAAQAGELTIGRSERVNNDHLATIAQNLQLSKCLRASKNTRFNSKADADSVEAVLGAVFLDSGRDLSEATRFVQAHILNDNDSLPASSQELLGSNPSGRRLSEKQARPMTALIVGASSGIGAALAKRLSARGDHISLCLVGRRYEALEAVAEGCRTYGARVTTVVGDVGYEYDVTRVAEQFADMMRGSSALPVVVCNAGVGAPGPTEEISAEACDAVLGTNVKGVLLTLRELLPVLREAPASQVVVTSSVLGLRSPSRGGNVVYTASKHAIEGAVDAVRNEYAGTGVKIGVVNPGGVRTEWFADPAKGGYTEEDRPDTSGFLEVEEVVDALLSVIDQAATTDIRRIVLENHRPK